MRAEATPARAEAPTPAAPGARGPFEAALRRAAEELALARARGLAGFASEGEGASREVAALGARGQAPGEPAEGSAGGPPAGAPTRAVAAMEVQRLGAQARLEIASADGIRYALAATPGGVEIQARAPPALERVARADLQAVADALQRRGVPLLRATVAAPEQSPVPAGPSQGRGRAR